MSHPFDIKYLVKDKTELEKLQERMSQFELGLDSRVNVVVRYALASEVIVIEPEFEIHVPRVCQSGETEIAQIDLKHHLIRFRRGNQCYNLSLKPK